MAGLLIKDIRLLMGQKRTFAICIVLVLAFALKGSFDSIFLTGYIMIFFTLLVSSTVTYDEMDNGYAFLFTLPFEKWEYVAEKYLVGLIMSGCAGLLSLGLGYVNYLTAEGANDVWEYLWALVSFLLVGQVTVWITLPVQFKFGADKSRYVLVTGYVLFFLALASRKWLAGRTGVNLSVVIRAISTHKATAIACLAALLLAMLAVSVTASIQILRKKEF